MFKRWARVEKSQQDLLCFTYEKKGKDSEEQFFLSYFFTSFFSYEIWFQIRVHCKRDYYYYYSCETDCICTQWSAYCRRDVKTSAIIRSTHCSLFSNCFTGRKFELHQMHATNPESLFVCFCDRSSERSSNWRTPTSASFRRGSATSAFQRVKTHLRARWLTHVGRERENYRSHAHYYKINATSVARWIRISYV